MRQYQKYDNRKLYDADSGEYASMLDLSDVAAAGEEVSVRHYRTGRDLTLETLARALYERLCVRRESPEVPFAPKRLLALFPTVKRRR